MGRTATRQQPAISAETARASATTNVFFVVPQAVPAFVTTMTLRSKRSHLGDPWHRQDWWVVARFQMVHVYGFAPVALLIGRWLNRLNSVVDWQILAQDWVPTVILGMNFEERPWPEDGMWSHTIVSGVYVEGDESRS